MPSVFYDHFYDWGNSTHDQIVKLVCTNHVQQKKAFATQFPCLSVVFCAAGHSEKSRYSQPFFNTDFGGPLKSLLCNRWGETVHEDRRWVMVPKWPGVETGNQWSQICSLAQVVAPSTSIHIYYACWQ